MNKTKSIIILFTLFRTLSYGQFEYEYFFDPSWLIENNIKSLTIGIDSVSFQLRFFDFDKEGRIIKKVYRSDEYFEYDYVDSTSSFFCGGKYQFEKLRYHGNQMLTDFPIKNDFQNRCFSMEKDWKNRLVTLSIYSLEDESYSAIFGTSCGLEWFDSYAIYIFDYRRNKLKKIERYQMDNYLQVFRKSDLRIRRRLNGRYKKVEIKSTESSNPNLYDIHTYLFRKDGSMDQIWRNEKLIVQFEEENDLPKKRIILNDYQGQTPVYDINYEFWEE